jgi:hypothetical protein
MSTTITGTATIPCLMGCGKSLSLGLDQVALEDLEDEILDRATAARWYSGCVCQSCTPAAAAADDADDWVSDGRP